MRVWHRDKPQLLKDELQSLDKFGVVYNVQYFGDNNSKVIIECEIPNKVFGNNTGQTLTLKVNYPDNFPFFRPEVEAADLDLPRHQNPVSKNLCLLGRASDYWNVQTIGEYLKERLPLIFEQGLLTDPEIIKDIPDEQAEPISEYYFSKERILFTSGRPEFLDQEIPKPSDELSILDFGKLKLALPKDFHLSSIFNDEGSPLKIHIQKWMDRNDNIIPNDFEGTVKFDKIKDSSWYLLSKFPGNDLSQNFGRKIIELINSSGSGQLKSLNIQTKKYHHLESCCLIFPEEQEAGIYKWGWLTVVFSTTFHPKKRKHPQFRGKFPIVCKNLSLSPTDLSQRIPQSRGLSGKTIGVIGAGAIGAPVVLELSKNGCRELKILDQDILELTNTVRWPLGNEYVGWNKVYALKDYVSKNYPSVTVKAYHFRIGNPYNESGEENKILEEFLQDCDLIIDASVEQGINHLISIRSRNWGIPYILMEGRRGGWGGLIARILPNSNKGCWMCLQNKLYSNEENDKIPIPPEDNTGTIQERGCGDVTFTGANFDMVNIPMAAVKLAANTLSTEENFEWDVAILSTIEEKTEKPTLPLWSMYTLSISENCVYKNDLHT